MVEKLNTNQREIRIAIHQPNFLPRLKVLQKLAAAHIWVVLDSVQYCSREWQNRARIVNAHGENHHHWLSIPVHRPKGQQTLIKDVTINNPVKTAQKVQNTIKYALRQTPFWNDVNKYILDINSSLVTESLTQLCVGTTLGLLCMVNIQPKYLLASSLSVTGKASSLMAAICRSLRANIYLADSGAKNYLKPIHFKDVTVLWQDWTEPSEKGSGIDRWRNLSCINYLSRIGLEQFKRHILSSRFDLLETWQHKDNQRFSAKRIE